MLTKEQKDIIYAEERQIRVASAAGSGKTTTLIGRITHLCNRGLPPESIMAITFTRRAGAELKGRLPDTAQGVTVGTFHSVILRSIQRSGASISILDDEDDVDELLDKAANAVGAAVNGKYHKHSRKHYKKQIAAIRAGRAGETPLYEAYVNMLAMNGETDYDGILHRGLRMAREGHFDWVKALLVDEAQDNEPMQWQFIRILAEKAEIMTVGDVGQSMYSFRGATPQEFEKQDYKPYELSESFRFPCNIADLSNAIGASSLKTVSKKAPIPYQIRRQEPDELVEAIVRAGTPAEDIAVLCRYNADVETIRAQLMLSGLPVCVPVKHEKGRLHDLLSALAAPHSATARGKLSHWQGLRPQLIQWAQSKMASSSFAMLTRDWLHGKQTIADILGAIDLADSDQNEKRRILSKFAGMSLTEYQASSLGDEWETRGSGVTVATVHWSKGGEWPVVIVPGLDKGRWPRNEKNQEEYRIFNVAVTRTIDNLYLLHGNEPSKFIDIARSIT